MSTNTTTKPMIRFQTLGGAHVHVTAGPDGYWWECQGCDQGEEFGQPLPTARTAANGHAGLCRSIPKTTR
ncbi:hypothetical protein [Actinomadura chokoriensis]|uniref:Uncharacterized protein n=1 Tax=Actinomadura chokoriensis TaxID=454156 RepID=A0ABV4RD94_9ACTN